MSSSGLSIVPRPRSLTFSNPAGTASTPSRTAKALPLLDEKAVPPPPTYEAVVAVSVPPQYAPTALFPTRDAKDRLVLSTRPRRSLRTPANLDGSGLPSVKAMSRCVVVTAQPGVAGFAITREMGSVEASATTPEELRLRLRQQGEALGAFAVVDVRITSTSSKEPCFMGVGRAVRFRKI